MLFLGIVVNTSLNLELISVHKSLDTIQICSVIKNFNSDNLFLKAALDFSVRQSNFDPDLIPNPEWVIAPPIFAADVPIGPNKRTISLWGSLQL